MSVVVECRSEYTYAQLPVAFTWQGQRYEVTQVIDQWRSPAGLNFRVSSQEDHLFTLTYHEADDQWSIQTDEIPNPFPISNPAQTEKERT